MRVTNSMVLRATMSDLNSSLSRLQTSQDILASGRNVRRPSDDPTRAAASMGMRTEQRRSDHRQRASQDATGWLDAASSTLMSGLDLMSRVKELTVQAANTGSATTGSRAAIASELRGIRDELLALANSRYVDRPVFNGTSAGQAYDKATGAYLGNDAPVVREIAPDTTITVNMTGESVFGVQSAPSGDLFAVLDRLATAVSSGDNTAIAAEQVNTDDARERMSQAVGELGTRAARVENVRARTDAQRADLIASISELEDADLAEAVMTVKTRENAYMAALQAASKIIPPSLVDYLR
jgi:flagellar hook-associated protein 3 FlgL